MGLTLRLMIVIDKNIVSMRQQLVLVLVDVVLSRSMMVAAPQLQLSVNKLMDVTLRVKVGSV